MRTIGLAPPLQLPPRCPLAARAALPPPLSLSLARVQPAHRFGGPSSKEKATEVGAGAAALRGGCATEEDEEEELLLGRELGLTLACGCGGMRRPARGALL
jgi:hypothetical protein